MARTLYYKGIQLPQLRSFCAVAAQGSFTAAARELGLSKPTVWQQVRALEREMKVALLRQAGNGLALTAEGQLLLKLIQPHVSGLDSLVRLFETQRAELQQWLTVASTPYLIAHRLPPVVRAYTRTHPSVRLQLQTDPWTEGVVGRVGQRHVDVGVVPIHPDEPRHPNLDYERLFDLEFLLLTAAQHPLARKKRVTPADLVQYPLIKGLSYNQQALENVLRRHNLLEQVHVVMETSSTDIILKYVTLGIGIAVLYAGVDRLRHQSGLHVRPFDPEETPNLLVALTHCKGAHLPEHVADFCALVRRCLGQRKP